MPRTAKLIRSIVIKTMIDDSPDTSYLGEYSNHYKSEWSIDREHTVECASQSYSVSRDTVNQLERVIGYLDKQRIADWESDNDSIWYTGLENAQDVLIDAQDSVKECDCGNSGSRSRNEYQWFNPVIENYKGSTDAEMRIYIAQDYERMESLHGMDWWYVGVRADAEIVIDGCIQEITSGGVWGIESDSDESYFAEIQDEELSELKSQLSALGFGKRAIATACKELTRKDGY